MLIKIFYDFYSYQLIFAKYIEFRYRYESQKESYKGKETQKEQECICNDLRKYTIYLIVEKSLWFL